MKNHENGIMEQWLVPIAQCEFLKYEEMIYLGLIEITC